MKIMDPRGLAKLGFPYVCKACPSGLGEPSGRGFNTSAIGRKSWTFLYIPANNNGDCHHESVQFSS